MCEYCENQKIILTIQIPHVLWGKYCYDVDKHVFIDRQYLRLCDIEDSQCLDHGEKIQIKFCPMCGYKLNTDKED